MLSSKHPISIKIDKTSTINKFGTTETYIERNSKKIVRVDIILYEKTINEVNKEGAKESLISENKDLDNTYKTVEPSTEEIIGAVSTHEGTHGTNKKANSLFVPQSDAEKEAQLKENEYLKQLNRK